MTTKEQFEANRKNAQKSTGPKSEEGKARSSVNARKHGLTSRQVWLEEEDGDKFREFRFQLMDELCPVGTLEAQLVYRIAAQMWRVARIPGIEAELFDRLRFDIAGEDDGLAGAWLRDGSPHGGALMRLSRYETAIERSIVRMTAELRKVQAERIKREAADGEYIRGEEDHMDTGPDGTLMPPDEAEEAWARALGEPLPPESREKQPHRQQHVGEPGPPTPPVNGGNGISG